MNTGQGATRYPFLILSKKIVAKRPSARQIKNEVTYLLIVIFVMLALYNFDNSAKSAFCCSVKLVGIFI